MHISYLMMLIIITILIFIIIINMGRMFHCIFQISFGAISLKRRRAKTGTPSTSTAAHHVVDLSLSYKAYHTVLFAWSLELSKDPSLCSWWDCYGHVNSPHTGNNLNKN